RTIIFHDPARAPLRVMSREEFERRWRPTERWMAVILPMARTVPSEDPRVAVPAPATSCDEQIQRGVTQAQASDLASAERTLTAALSCPGPSATRELAGVRLLQRRWEDVSELASEAAAMDPADPYVWRLLGTSRFLLN